MHEPEWPLWSSGADKLRLVSIPSGPGVETSGSAWDFPIGTVFSKTFSFDGVQPAMPLTDVDEPARVPIETRLLFRRKAGWDYAVYQWQEGRTQATLVEEDWIEVPVDLVSAEGEPFTYTIPARLDCLTCHDTSSRTTGTPVLGLGPYQLSKDLEDTGALGEASRIPVVGRSPEETEAFGYFIGNCVSCHNGGTSENSASGLLPEVAAANTIGIPSEITSAEGIRVVPGDPESSVLFLTVVRAGEPGYQGAFKSMPPLGISTIDPAAEDILGNWIEGL
jgi:hypothetical protein